MRILMVGLGGIGQRHVRNLRALLGEGAEIIAWRVRRLSHVVTPTLRSDDSLDADDRRAFLLGGPPAGPKGRSARLASARARHVNGMQCAEGPW